MGYIKLKYGSENLQGKEVKWKVPEKKKSHPISLWILVVGLYVNMFIHYYQEYRTYQEQIQYQEELLLAYQERLKVLQEQTESLEELLEIFQGKKEGQ